MNMQLLRAEWRALGRVSLRMMHGGLSVIGIAAIAGAVWLATHPEYADALGRWMSPVKPAPAPEPVALVPQPDPFDGPIAHPANEAGRMLGLAARDAVPANDEAIAPASVSLAAGPDRKVQTAEQRQLTRYLSRKYRVASDAVALVVDAAFVTGQELKLDPALLLAVIGVESGFNPFAESTAGASGLMQLMSKVHRDKLDDFGGAHIALNPVANLRVGAVVLKDCIRRGGSIADGLRLYVGSGVGDDNGYGARVLQEKDRIAQAMRGNGRGRIDPIPAVTVRTGDVPQPDAAERDDKPRVKKAEATPRNVAAL